jgi:hypothetical protein
MTKKIILIIALLLFILPLAVSAKTDLWQTRQQINIKKPVDGEAVLLGESIIIEQGILEDLIAVGRNITISGPVGQDLRAASENIFINSQINGNATIWSAARATIDKAGEIRGNLRVWSQILEIQGEVLEDVKFSGSVVKITGQIGGNVNLGKIVDLKIGPNTRIGGDLKYKAKKTFDIPRDAVAGKINYQPVNKASISIWRQINWFWQIVWFFAALAVGLILINSASPQIKKINVLMVKNPGKSLLLGLVFSFILPIIAMLLMVTLIGIPLGISIFGLWLLLLYIAPILVAFILGKLIVYSFAKDKKIIKKTSMIWFMMIGLLGLKLLFLTPWFGGIIKLLTIFWGFGGVMFLFKSKFLNDSKS